jgi:uncharacterized protein
MALEVSPYNIFVNSIAPDWIETDQSSKDNRTFVATFVVFFAVTNFLKVIAYSEVGILSAEIVLSVAAISPLIIFGGFLGNALNKRVSQKTFKVVAFGAILIIEISLPMKTTTNP